MNTKALLERAVFEINGLRRENEVLRAKMEMIDLFACVLHTKPAQNGGGAMSPDIVYEMQKEIRDLETPKSAS